MSSKLPIVKQASVLSLFVQLLVLASVCAVSYQFDRENYLLYGAGCFVIIAFILRSCVPRYHRKGISLYKKRKYDQAIPYFEKSYAFFAKHRWIDRYRFITMLSSSRVSYTEMALLNIAFCRSQSGSKEDAIRDYKKVLEEFKDSEMAISALKMLE